MFLTELTKNKALPACLIRLLLLIAGIEQNPGPWICPICDKNLISYAVECVKCNKWLHIKCSKLKSTKERKKITNWIGPCCLFAPSPPQFRPSPPPPTPRPRRPPTNHHQHPQQQHPQHHPQQQHPQHHPQQQQPQQQHRQQHPQQQQQRRPSSPPAQRSQNNQQNQGSNLRVLQYNINGINNKIDELLDYMEKRKILIGVLQETKLTSKSKLKKTNNYTLIRKDRGTNKGGGLAFLVHKDVSFNLEPTPQSHEADQHLESLTISLPSKDNNHLFIRNIYIPPQSSCHQQYQPPINHLFDNLGASSLILGDFNAHHEMWHTDATEDARGRIIVDTIAGLDYGIINEDLPTRLQGNSATSPDLSIVSSNLIPTTSWKTETKMSSDHLPVIIDLTAEFTKTNTKNFTYINFNKADWPKFKDFTENIFSNARPVEDVFKAERFFRKTVQKAASKFIPAGRIPRTYNSIPTEAARLIEERDNLRTNDPADNRIHDLNININKLINDHRKEKWNEHLSTCQAGSKKLWNTIKSLNDHPIQPDNQGISFENKTTNDPKKMANLFNKQYTPAIDKKPEQVFRNTLRNMKKKSDSPLVVFTPAQTAAAIKKAKNSKALGPDELSPVMLKNLGIMGIKFLTDIFNKCLLTTHIPAIWKIAKIIPLLKPGKPINQGTSYRPVSLLSPAAKILEALLLPHVTDSINLANHQHGFRKGRSTTTALISILDHINKGLNRKKPVHRTVSVAIDLSKAFDTVDHQLLLDDIKSLPLNGYITSFLCAYLRGRYTFVLFRNAKGKCRKVKQGVPQGGVLSPILFNLYMSSMPAPPGNIEIVSYADDGNVLNSGPQIEPLVTELNSYLSILNNWFKSRNLFISPSKSSATLFTTSSNEVSTTLEIRIDGQEVPTVKKPKILGITFDNLLSFRQHAQDLKSKLHTKNNVLKALSGSNWGKEKEVMVTTYKAISQSVLNYCCPVWTPSLSETSWKGLQTAQNAALRVATGCHLMTDVDHLHHETKVMKVKPHCEMLSQQFLLSTQSINHPNKVNLSAPPPPRQMKNTLSSTFGEKVKQISYPDMPTDIYKKKLKNVHTSCVRDQINSMAKNKVLNTTPPKISDSEKVLPRATRSTLAQLRSGYSSYLNSYKARISQNQATQIVDTCPLCNAASHTTTHLFSCPSKPTQLTVRDLWSKPLEAARFLNLASNDDDPG